MNVATLDRPHRLDTLQRCFRGSERLETLAGIDDALQSGVIGFDPVVLPLLVDMEDRIIRAPTLIDLVNDLGIGRRLVGENRHRLVKPRVILGLPQESARRLCVPPGCKSEIDQLAMMIDRTPEIAPLSANSYVCFIDMPIEAAPAAPTKGSFGNLRPKFLDPTVDRRRVNLDSMFGKHVPNIPI